MTQLLIQVSNEKDLTLLTPLFNRLGVQYKKIEKPVAIEAAETKLDLLQFFDEITNEDDAVFKVLAQ